MFRPIVITRILFVLLATACGYWLAIGEADPVNASVTAFIMAVIIVIFEYSLRTVSSRRLLLASLGLLFGLIVSVLVYETIPAAVIGDPKTARIVCNFLFGYLGVVIALKHADLVSLGGLRLIGPSGNAQAPMLVDTSVIIDGRIRDLIALGFLSGNLLVPTFVLRELQVLADSADPIKRGKGRRGLNILEGMRDDFPNLQLLERDFPELDGVDRKLVELARELKAQIITNDYNLQKVASLYNVAVLNLNELSDVLRPPVFVGETFPLSIIREGKEPRQGIGYLADGTMVVVDEGEDYINQEIEVVVASVLQTSSGRMVFARPLTSEKTDRRAASRSGDR